MSTSPSGPAALGSPPSSAAPLAPSSVGLSADPVPSARGRLSSSAARLHPSEGRLPASPDRLPSSLALAFWRLPSSSPVAFWPRPFASLLSGSAEPCSRLCSSSSCRAWSETCPHPATNPTSTSKASTHTKDRTFVISRIVLSFVSRPSWPFLLYGPRICTTSSARFAPSPGVLQRHRSAPLSALSGRSAVLRCTPISKNAGPPNFRFTEFSEVRIQHYV